MKSSPAHKRPGWLPALLLAAFAVAVSGWAAFLLHLYREGPLVEVHEKGYQYISPLLECGGTNQMDGLAQTRLEQRLRKVIDEKMETGTVTQVSVYFRDLNNGPWIGINDNELFTPGSMLKVPLMMAWYRQAEKDPAILLRKVRFKPLVMPGGQVVQDVEPEGRLIDGNEYTIDELIRNMIVYSDNSSTAILIENLPERERNRAFSDLGLDIPPASDWTTNFITVQKYATFFRVLINASYLNKDYSSRALELLTKVSFRDGLVAGVPRTTQVAHKFGIRGTGGSNLVQLHDCGIVYVPTQPYLLCVMTRGTDEKAQASVIADLSRTVYDSVTRPFF